MNFKITSKQRSKSAILCIVCYDNEQKQVRRYWTYFKHLLVVRNQLKLTELTYKKDAESAIPQWQVGMSKRPDNVWNEKCD